MESKWSRMNGIERNRTKWSRDDHELKRYIFIYYNLLWHIYRILRCLLLRKLSHPLQYAIQPHKRRYVRKSTCLVLAHLPLPLPMPLPSLVEHRPTQSWWRHLPYQEVVEFSKIRHLLDHSILLWDNFIWFHFIYNGLILIYIRVYIRVK